MRALRKLQLISVLWLLGFTLLWAEDNQVDHQYSLGVSLDYSFPNHKGLNHRGGMVPIAYGEVLKPENFDGGIDPGRDIGSNYGSPFIALKFSHSMEYPLFQGDNWFTSSNNLRIKSTLSVSPITVGMDVDSHLTVLPFLVLKSGLHLGSGWKLGDVATGIGLNRDGTGEPSGSSFMGMVSKGYLGAKIQFDLAAVLDNATDWDNLQLSYTGVFQYQHFNRASNLEPWFYGSDDNFNGWKFRSLTSLGYGIPNFMISKVFLSLETSSNMGEIYEMSPMDQRGWGSDFLEQKLTLGTLWPLGENETIGLSGQWQNGLVYSEETLFMNYFQNRASTGDTYWCFKSISLSYTLQL